MADYDKVIPPGQEGKITVKIYGKKIQPGRFNKGWTIATNDPENERFAIHIMGTVTRVFEQSEQLSLTGFWDEEIRSETVLTNNLDRPIIITGWHWDERALEFGLDKKLGVKLEELEKGKKYRVAVWKNPKVEADTYRGDIVLTTDYAEMKEKSLPVRITVTRDVEIQPNKVYFGEMVVPEGTSKSFDRQFRIIAARGDSLQILSAIPDREDVTVNIQEVQAGKVYKGTVRVRPPSKMGSYEGSIKIRTNYPGYEEITLSVIGRVRADYRAEGAKSPTRK